MLIFLRQSVSGFTMAAILLIAALAFAKVSLDQSDVESIVIVGTLDDAQLVNLKSTLAGLELKASDADVVQQNLEQLAWVRGVKVRREWPRGLSVEVDIETVMAYWNDDAFINKDGRVLHTDLLMGGDLPHLYGQPGSEREVMIRYQQLSGMLKNHGHDIKTLSRNDRGSWSIETRDRIEVLLGKEDLKARMDRFLEVSNKLQILGEKRAIERMDARYVNGVAVHFSETEALDLGSL